MAEKMYDELADWWPLISGPEEYIEEAAFYQRALLEACSPPARTLLELGSGGGNNASQLKAQFQMVLVDRSPQMLTVSRRLNPECEHVEGDMRTIRLGRQFDCVFVHDAIMYMRTLAELRAAIETAYEHCRSGGAALFAPDHVQETFKPSTEHGGRDDASRGVRYLAWIRDPDPADNLYTVDYAFLFRDSDGTVHAGHDRHIEGLFGRAQWLQILTDVGFQPAVVPFNHSELDQGSSELFVCRKG